MDAAKVQTLACEVIAAHSAPGVSTKDLFGAWFDAGLTWIHFPKGRGGLGLPKALQTVADQELLDAGFTLPRLANKNACGFVAPTLLEHASDELIDRFLRPIATTEEIWCQLFSEPGAGSDLAGLATNARRQDESWIVSGQKVWSSQAHRAHWGILLARTDPDVPKHQGITFFVVDMHSPGIEVRPLRQLTGRVDFNEVFLDGVIIPDRQRVGAIGTGWNVARTTLANERMSIGDRRGGRQAPSAISEAMRLWSEHPSLHTAVLRDRLTQLWLRAEAHRLTCDRLRMAPLKRGRGNEGSIAKLVSAELNQAAYEFSMELLGPDATSYGCYDADAPETYDVQERFLRVRANTVEGGTAEIQRNIIAERILGLPEEHRPDRGRSWRESRRV